MKLPFFKKFNFEIPLAWSQLSHQKVRLAVATTGVCFANILMFTQVGLLKMLTEGTTKLHESLGGDLFLVSSFSPTLRWNTSFPRAYVYQASAVDGVADTTSVYLDTGEWLNPEFLLENNQDDSSLKRMERFGKQVRIIAFNPAKNKVLNLPDVQQQINKLRIPNSILYDSLSQSSLGEVPEIYNQQGKVTTLVDNHRTDIVGLFDMGSTLFTNGNVVMSDWNYSQRRGSGILNNVSIGLVFLEKGANIDTVKTKIRAILPPDIEIHTREELITKEQKFESSEPNGIVLRFGTAVGFVVGVIIVYQVLYADINDHLSEYATLKAMGYSDNYLLFVVIQEAVILAIMGFIPGYIASLGLYQLLVSLTKIPLAMRASVAIQVFILTVVMCVVSGAIATSKLRSADPADVF
ncbi:FtsX-like permease family protein [Plectonema cf. radiosum LEGE 06105]|uniref:FtsX-like permease family protein n=1 Tax=Plectonema cf. radiosum LEGE 06105 TaxID=945769 RepID=A0A8J7JUP1_9CYAN|nr:ABC transporter permease DevC [Plectonema radiosum]MBE9215234.1 FtsX-like permease family protein [Plectonema cf. radiosum LEGE 06105]